MRMFELVSGLFHLLLALCLIVLGVGRPPPPPLPLSLQISLQTLLRGVRLLMEETNCLQHCLLFSLMTLRDIALLILKVVRFSAVGCLLNLRSAFFLSFIAFSQSASNHGLTMCFGAAEDLGTVSSAIEIKVSVKLAMASGLLWMSAVSLQRSSSTLHETSNSRMGWVIVRSIAV